MDDCHLSGAAVVGFIPGDWRPPASLNAAQKAEVDTALVEFTAAMQPAAPGAIAIALGNLALAVRMHDMPEAAWRMHLDQFAEDLAEYPLDIIEATCREWRRTQRFWPTIAEFLEIAGPKLRLRKSTLRRLHALQCIGDNPAPGGRITAEWFRCVVGENPDRKRGGFVALEAAGHGLTKSQER